MTKQSKNNAPPLGGSRRKQVSLETKFGSWGVNNNDHTYPPRFALVARSLAQLLPPKGGAMALVAIILLCMNPTYAQQRYKVVQYSSGTGFFVSKTGHLVTNAHVIDKCRSAQIKGDGMITQARILDKDTKHDMALLHANTTPLNIATFRPISHRLNKGDKLTIVGHPLGKSLTTASSELIADTGPMGEKEWLQFSNSIFEGNSGGPLLDESGQVVGMVTAKSTLYRYNPNRAKKEVVSNTDVAIRTYMLEHFLEKNRVRIRRSDIETNLSSANIAQKAKNYIVQIKCVVES